MKSNTHSIAGKRGESVRSDCYVEIQLKNTGGIELSVKSKVQVMYGNSIKNHVLLMSDFFGIKNATILIEDSGALIPTLSARFELAVKRLFPEMEKEFLPEIGKSKKQKTLKDRLRRSRLYPPGNEPKFFPNAGLHKPDAIILDLEDSVALTEKDA
ncbi:MAG: citrate lyase ACP, partial [Bacteroidetes bacterium]|nr:citrate lyase ACP [Bacteroidota bacterium]